MLHCPFVVRFFDRSVAEAAAAALGILCADGEAAQSTLLRAGAVPALVRPLRPCGSSTGFDHI